MTTTGELNEPPAPAYFASLNAAQREAVEFGIGYHNAAAMPGPLLVIAGAGSGKTNTLAHRVAYLIANGASCSVNCLGNSRGHRRSMSLVERCNR